MLSGAVRFSSTVRGDAREHGAITDEELEEFVALTGAGERVGGRRERASFTSLTSERPRQRARERELAKVNRPWMASPGHCRNIMRETGRDAGSGYATGESAVIR